MPERHPEHRDDEPELHWDRVHLTSLSLLESIEVLGPYWNNKTNLAICRR